MLSVCFNSSPDCAVCSKAIKGKVGKQGYQCRGEIDLKPRKKSLLVLPFLYSCFHYHVLKLSFFPSGCKMVTHRDCHYQTTAMCSSDEVKHMDM